MTEKDAAKIAQLLRKKRTLLAQVRAIEAEILDTLTALARQS